MISPQMEKKNILLDFFAQFPTGLDVQWTPASSATVEDAYLRNWLLDTGSLTERLQSMCRHFELIKLGQAEAALHASEKQWLGETSSHRAKVREVLLCGNHQPWVFARSVIPHALVAGELADLGTQPLGKRLFNDARFTRSEFELCKLTASTPGHQLPVPLNQTLWGRRSKFRFLHYSLLVAEVFLHPSPPYKQGLTYAN